MKIIKSTTEHDKATVIIEYPNCCGCCPFDKYDGEFDIHQCEITREIVDGDAISEKCPLGWKQ